jgi:hypothetical protein
MGGEFKYQELSLWRLGKPNQQTAHESSHLCEPLPQSKTLVEGWKRGELVFQFHVGLWSGFSGGQATEFCADLEYSPARSEQRLGDLAVTALDHAPLESLGQEVHGLKRPVLIEVVQVRKDDKGVKRPVPLCVSIRLSGPENCRVCAADTRQTGMPLLGSFQGRVEGLPRRAHGERDGSLLLGTQRFGRGATSSDKSPREVVERASVIVGDGAKSQRDPRGGGTTRSSVRMNP